MQPLRIRIYSKKDCHLCEEAKEVVHRFAKRYPLALEVIDIEKDPVIFAKYRHQIPVVYLEESKIFKYRIDEEKLDKAIRKRLS